MCFMVDAILKMNGKDEVGDVKQFLHQITQVPVDAMSLRHLRNPYLDNDTRLETLTKDDDLSLVMIAPSHKHLVMKIREVRDKCQDECVSFPLSYDVVVNIRGAFIVSQGLDREKPQMKEKKISSYPASLPSASTDGVSTMATLKVEINRLEMQILENKQRIADLKQQCKTVPVVIKLRQPSGNLLDIGTNIGKTVGQFKREDVSALVDVSANNIQLMVGANLMSNKKRLFSYNITEGSVVDMILMRAVEEDDNSSSEEIVADITPPQTELEKHHTKIDMSNFLEDDTNQIELNEASEERPKKLDIKVEAVSGTYTLVFNYSVADKVSDVFSALSDRFGLERDAFSLYYPNGRSYFQDWEPIDASVADGRAFVCLCIKVLGGGKRAKAEEENTTAKELKQFILNGLIQLEDATHSSEVIDTVVARVKFIIGEVEKNPSSAVLGLLKHVDKMKLAKIATGTLGSGTRVSARAKFIAENSLDDIFSGVEGHSYKLKVASQVMVSAVQFAVMTQYSDAKGDIGWVKFLEQVANMMTQTEAVEAPAGGCILM